MEKDLVKYLKHHTMRVTVLVVAAFLLLAAGEYYLYRQTMQLKSMVSEGLMQLKEAGKENPEPTPTPEVKKVLPR